MSTNNKNNTQFTFPLAHSTVLPDPSRFFSPNLLSKPLPTNSFFQNFVLKNGDQPEYIHPYLIKSSNSSLSLSYPSRSSNSKVIHQVFNADLTITSRKNSHPLSTTQLPPPLFNISYSHHVFHTSLFGKVHAPPPPFNGTHKISSYSDLSVTLDIPSSNLRFFLVRGSPFVTFSVTNPTPLSISTVHTIVYFSSNASLTKFTFKFNNGQTWLLYASSPIKLSHNPSEITSEPFSGIIRLALLPHAKNNAVLDKYNSCYCVW